VITPYLAIVLGAIALPNARADVLKNSRPLSDPRLVG
jgi:hypothetical protein